MKFRPWGPLDWTLSLSSPKNWFFVGTLGTEERSLASWDYLRSSNSLTGELFAEVTDSESDKYRDQTRIALENRRTKFSSGGGLLTEVQIIPLMAELFQVLDFSKKAEALGDSVILDITSFPKRFFFPILRTLTLSSQIRNLLLTYTSPQNYADDPLYEDIEPWKTLPGFGGTGAGGGDDLWVVSVGFLVESLRQYVGCNPHEKMKLLVPFPAPLAVLRRTWESIATLERDHKEGRFEKYRVESLDMSGAFDRIQSLAGTPAKSLAFAPFGPKPTAAAMCLYAIQKDSSVHYPQPTVYHPEYSTGIRHNDPKAAVSSYWVKHEGENLFAL